MLNTTMLATARNSDCQFCSVCSQNCGDTRKSGQDTAEAPCRACSSLYWRQPVSDSGYIDTAAAGIAFWRRTTHFSCRLDAADIDEDINGGIDRKRDNIRHG